MKRKGLLELSNGMRFHGGLIGASKSVTGEMVFTTGMVAYAESVTDPSFFGQILVFAYPLVGNYGIVDAARAAGGIPPEGQESKGAKVTAVIISTESPDAYHWESVSALDAWLAEQGVPGIVGIDTRHLIQVLRDEPNLFGRVLPESAPAASAGFYDPNAVNVLTEVSVKSRVRVGKGRTRIALVDCGVKWGIVRRLAALGCEVELLPWDTDFSQVDCDAWLISNGPGDPTRTGDLVPRLRGLLEGSKPVLGICLGNQLLALAAGAKTGRMRHGHRSHNQPVFEVASGRAFLTSQNHSYAVLKETLPADWEVWFANANDGSVEGIRHRAKPIRAVQFHPEAAGGPWDTAWILEEFVKTAGGA